MKTPSLGICLSLAISPILLSSETFDPSRYNVTWEPPGKGPQDSMPLGNGDITLNALRHRWHRGHTGWRQDVIFMAWLGLAEETREAVLTRSLSHDPNTCPISPFSNPASPPR